MRTPRGEIERHLVPLILLLAFLLLLVVTRFDLNGQLAEEARNGLSYARVSAERPGIDGRLLGRHFPTPTGIGVVAGAHLLMLLLKSSEQRGVHVGDLQLLSGRCRSGAIRDLREI